MDRIDKIIRATKKKCQENDISMYRIAKGTKLTYPTVLSIFKGIGNIASLKKIIRYVDNYCNVYSFDPEKDNTEDWEKED